MSIRLTLARRKTARMQASVQSKIDELGQHSSELKSYMQALKDFTALRDSEPVVKCANPIGGWPCGAEMRQGDYRCHACSQPNAHHVDRGVEPPQLPMLT